MSDKEPKRMQLEDAVYQALEAGMTVEEVKSEVEYALESVES